MASKKQYCSFCKNHGIKAEKKGHKSFCPYTADNHWKMCIEGCYDTRSRQTSVAEEKKQKYHLDKNVKTKPVAPEGKKRAPKTCSKCKNHGSYSVMSVKHKCPFVNCKCKLCEITDNRRGRVKTDVTNMRRNQSSVLNTPPSTPGSFSSQSSPTSSSDAPSPLRFESATQEDNIYDEPMLTPTSMTHSPADLNVQSPDSGFSSPTYDLFTPTGLPAMSPPSATLVQQDFEYNKILNELRALPEPQDHTLVDIEMTEVHASLVELMNTWHESVLDELYAVCTQTLGHQAW